MSKADDKAMHQELGLVASYYYDDPTFVAWMGYLGIKAPDLGSNEEKMYYRVDTSDFCREAKECSLDSLVMGVYLKRQMPWEWDKFRTLIRIGVIE